MADSQQASCQNKKGNNAPNPVQRRQIKQKDLCDDQINQTESRFFQRFIVKSDAQPHNAQKQPQSRISENGLSVPIKIFDMKRSELSLRQQRRHENKGQETPEQRKELALFNIFKRVPSRQNRRQTVRETNGRPRRFDRREKR